MTIPPLLIADQASDKDVSCDEVNHENHYDKMFDDTLLRLAKESSKTISCNGATDPKERTSSRENKVTSSQEPDVGVTRRTQRNQIIDCEESVSEFDGEISLKIDETSLEKKQIQSFSNDSPYHSNRINDNSEKNIPLAIKKLCRIEVCIFIYYFSFCILQWQN